MQTCRETDKQTGRQTDTRTKLYRASHGDAWYTNDPHLLPDKRNNILLSNLHCRTTLKMNWPCTVAATVVLLLFHATCSLSIDGKLIHELSYRKQIARQRRTQFAGGISVTFKSTLRVTQGHWKRNHWTDHTRLTIRLVIGRWTLSWPWNVGQRSLKVIESGTIWKFEYGFLTFPTLTLGLGVKVIENGAVR